MPERKFVQVIYWMLQLPVRLLIWVALRPRLERPGALQPDEVNRVYNRQARTYDRTHHLTTRGQDLFWRRLAGWVAVLSNSSCPDILDLCTGTGLSVKEIENILSLHNRQARITGIDFNRAMLAHAENLTCAATHSGIDVVFKHADATDMVEKSAQIESEFSRFPPKSFDVVTQIFGIGGINNPHAVFEQVLEVLREGGKYLLIDMHCPIPEIAGEVPLLWRWLRTPGLEAYTYEYTTKPLALARLWAWRDTTMDFYLAPLVCDEDRLLHRYWGFRILWRSVQSERWWLGVPVMPTCYLLLEKVEISYEEYKERQEILGSQQL